MGATDLTRLFAMSIEQAEAALERLTPEQAEAIMFEANDLEDEPVEHVVLICKAAAERAGWEGYNLGDPGSEQRLRVVLAKAKRDKREAGKRDESRAAQREWERREILRDAKCSLPAYVRREGRERGVRDALIRRAIESGMTRAEVSKLTGLSRPRVGRIARGGGE